jgi:hypothetical protein
MSSLLILGVDPTSTQLTVLSNPATVNLPAGQQVIIAITSNEVQATGPFTVQVDGTGAF